MQHLDPHQRPPEGIRNVYKKYQKMKPKDLEEDQNIVDLTVVQQDALPEKVRVIKNLEIDQLKDAFRTFAGNNASDQLQHLHFEPSIAVYDHEDMPGNISTVLFSQSSLSCHFILTVGRSLHHPNPPPPRHPTNPPLTTLAPRPLQPSTPHQHPHPLQHFVSAFECVLFLHLPIIPRPCRHSPRPLHPQAPHSLPTPQQENALDHPRRPV